MTTSNPPICFQGLTQQGLGDRCSDAYIEPQNTEFLCDGYKPINNNTPKGFQGSTQWALVPLGTTLI